MNLAYHLPGIEKSAVIGVGGGRDLLSAHLFGVKDITGVELNGIFVDLLPRDPFYRPSRTWRLPGLKLASTMRDRGLRRAESRSIWSR